MTSEIHADVAIIGAGTAGLYALREVRRARKSFVLIDRGPLGTTCARVGCMPSKSALHVAELWGARLKFARFGGDRGEALALDRSRAWQHVRMQRDGFTASAAGKAREGAGEHLIEGHARFLEPNVLEVEGPGGRRIVRAGAVVIATGSHPVRPAWLQPLGKRVVSTDELFELETVPDAIGVLGLGAIGLEMGLALARLGVRVVGADVAAVPAGIADPVVAERAITRFGKEIELWLGETASVAVDGAGLALASGERRAQVDLVLAALGRRPNTDGLDLAAAGVALGPRGEIPFDPATMQVGALPMFVAGDASGDRPLMHEAADEGAIAGFNAARGLRTRFRRKVALGIAFSQPDVAAVGERFDALDPASIIIGSAEGATNGRSRVLDAGDNLLRIYADAASGRLRGAALVSQDGEHLAHLLAWAIQRGETAAGLLEMPFYHPVVEEMVQSALQDIVGRIPAVGGLPPGLSAEEA
ncbi:MAG: dihydrolipoyl dehydrogenase [Rhodocyclaceae bacterium]|jgi:dihydrolipoamide dehydrogenase|nr:dihydrolipoyl dehydrogenase [Rhodocyclaceae bacterium]